MQAEFVVCLNPKLHPVGDFVTRCLWQRVQVLYELLQGFRQKCLAAVTAAGRTYSRQREEAERSWDELTRAVLALRTACQTGLCCPLRDSCIILTQIYLAFHPVPDVNWLGLPEHIICQGVNVLHHRFMNGRNGEMADRIAAALGDLRRLYEEAPLRQSALEEAIGSGGLVLVAEPAAAYWEGQCIVADWGKYPSRWRMLNELACKARLAGAVEERDLYAAAMSESILATTLGRLKALLPASLHKLVVPGTSRRSYRLVLEPQRIHFFAHDSRGP
jgi:hypothetical protein